MDSWFFALCQLCRQFTLHPLRSFLLDVHACPDCHDGCNMAELANTSYSGTDDCHWCKPVTLLAMYLRMQILTTSLLILQHCILSRPSPWKVQHSRDAGVLWYQAGKMTIRMTNYTAQTWKSRYAARQTDVPLRLPTAKHPDSLTQTKLKQLQPHFFPNKVWPNLKIWYKMHDCSSMHEFLFLFPTIFLAYNASAYMLPLPIPTMAQ